MGDRTISYKICPKCGKEYEVYDAPSSMMYSARCKCGFDENKAYFELDNCLYLIPRDIKNHIDSLNRRSLQLSAAWPYALW
jgi:hypothetical protein